MFDSVCFQVKIPSQNHDVGVEDANGDRGRVVLRWSISLTSMKNMFLLCFGAYTFARSPPIIKDVP